MIKAFVNLILTGVLMSGPFSHASTPPPVVLIMLGPPGSGKGTQAKMLEQNLQLPHISTGDLLRDHIRRNTELGKLAQSYMDKGNLVPDDLVLDMLFERVSQKDCVKGYILDGFPRTIPQAEAFQKRLEKQTPPVVINLDLSDEKVLERLTKRVVCEDCGTSYHLVYSPPEQPGKCDKCSGKLIQRPDDTEAVITKRLKVYNEQTAPLISFYSKQNLLHTIDCSTNKEKVFNQILSIVKHTKT
jgi:adenylate kinase